MSFKMGDRVRIIDTPYMADELSVGQTGIIIAISNDMCAVVMDSGHESEIGYWNFYESELELISV